MITDALEIQLLSQIQAKRAAEMRVQSQQEWGLKRMTQAVNRMQIAPVSPAIATAQAADQLEFKAPDGIMNRSPVTNNHYHNYPPASPTVVVEPQPPTVIHDPTPVTNPTKSGLSPWWLVLPLAIIIAGSTYLLWPKPKPAPVVQQAQPTLNSTIRWSQVP